MDNAVWIVERLGEVIQQIFEFNLVFITVGQLVTGVFALSFLFFAVRKSVG